MKLTPATLLFLTCLLLSAPGQAHKRWFMPTDFTLSDAETVTVDFTASNNIFYVDTGMPLAIVTLANPAGEQLALANPAEGARRSSFDVNVDADGTYRIAAGGPPMYFVSYQLPDQTETQHARGSLDKLKADLPEDASAVKFVESHSLIEAYVTLGAGTVPAPPRDNTGLKLLIKDYHPNELYSDETAQFSFTLNGKPAAGLAVVVQGDGSRYRDIQQEQTYETDTSGTVTVTWPGPGRYLIEASLQETLETGEIAERYYTYYLTLEVMPP
ncbi:MAG: DUF4198 domain-containing protein [Halioglobus sp.]|nr:DUF4198 domain-containing protein [Halioglobus sp.]